MPRVNLFIADDVGLGKTIEAGLIARELLIRKKVNYIVVACPPSMLSQWQDELSTRFGLQFEILDKEWIQTIRQRRGFSANPFAAHSRFLISHRLLIDETYAAPLRDFLGESLPGSLLILDEAHHAAPSSGAQYSKDSQFTEKLRDLAPRFEHRLFLSATPHNGHSSSFTALLEPLDPQRFIRGTEPSQKNLADVMVRRLKEDLRQIQGGFPERKVIQIDLPNLPPDSPDLLLPELLDQYDQLRRERLRGTNKHVQSASALLISNLQQRLLSSIPAFVRTLAVHKRYLRKEADKHAPTQFPLLAQSPSSDDDDATLPAEELAKEEDAQTGAATALTSRNPVQAEIDLVDRMNSIAQAARYQPDARVRYLHQWILDHCITAGQWNHRRVIVFTTYEDTLIYLRNQLEELLAPFGDPERRISVYRGETNRIDRQSIKDAFNAPPRRHPIRILLATDAAREGLNLQAHCSDLFHFDVPWNPARLEQRNGRIDRKLQPASEVHCYYFNYTQRPEDRILSTLVRKVETIREELGSLSQVLESRLTLTHLRRDALVSIEHDMVPTSIDRMRLDIINRDLEAQRERRREILEARLIELRRWASRPVRLDPQPPNCGECYSTQMPPDPAFASPPPARLLSHRLRLLYPFRVPRAELPHIAASLTQEGLWVHQPELNEEFRKEMTEAASDFVFGALRDQPAPYYFQHRSTFDIPNVRHSKKQGARFECFLNGDRGEKWIAQRQQSREAEKDEKRPSPPAVAAFFVDPQHHAEIFLNPFGCGILSLALIRDLPAQPEPWAGTLDFSYYLSHLKYREPILWRVKPGSPALTPSVAGEDHAHAEDAWVQSLPSGTRPPLERAATANSPFTLPELFDALLAPIASQLAGTQGQFSIYSVLEFAPEADLSGPAFLPALRAMAQLEEGAHPPTVSDAHSLETICLTNRHLAAGTTMGIVHFVAQQFPLGSHGYDTDRAPRLLVKYFAITLAAYFQAQALQGYQRAAAELLRSGAPAPASLAALSGEVNLFAVQANLEVVNRREANNLYYACLRRAFRLAPTLQALQQPLRDASAALESHQQTATLAAVHHAQTAISKAQHELEENEGRLGNLELFIVLVYILEMAHIFGEFTLAAHGYSLAAALSGMTLALLLMLLVVKGWPAPLFHLLGRQKKTAHARWTRVALAALVLYVLALLAPLHFHHLQKPHPVPACVACPPPPKTV